ncbi:hypothetical protein ACWYBI_003082 [Salmonella enterica subsp. enterica serovar Cerro]|uniref:hypothetical protein n=1 Tax=Salmonella phage SPN3UB TaxID=1147140 RepID=UPI0002528743|nr:MULTISPECIES: hypothetical protein [Salmonella]YP_007010994.1 hypothetical protein F482_gp24 [Salmonella phage SPN3UB]APW05453.1 hypothetical protein SEES3845_007650 [Salmonella enterica subsp. enterica serovar Senftenberg str. ATCC 43845]KCU91668.1 hypothetical protein KY1_17710 [Salmonella enterica subsp. enterica serovar Cerro str. FSL R8-0235]KWQ20444.1 hypothetical protein Y107_22430 [Salmonella enterica subsp. enterica serovar Tennessee]MCL8783362.1 hypothetical protein [Salmonella en
MEDEKKRQMQLQLTLQRRLEKVTPELFSEYLFERGVKTVICPICGSDDISIPNASSMTVGPEGCESNTYAIPVKLDTEGPPYSLVKYEYRLICKNCAYSMHFATWPVLKWVEQKLSDSGKGTNE